MSRPHDWPQRLLSYVAMAKTRDWQWGLHDCCSFARGAVLAAGGPDLGADWSGQYRDEEGARRSIIRLGRNLESAIEAVCSRAGLPEVDPRLAHRGDLLVLLDRQQTAGLPLAAICLGRNAVGATRRGVLTLPMSMCVRAWAIA